MDALYYTFSTIAQVVAAIVAILAAFSFFRIGALHDLLIGHGSSMLARWNDKGYKFLEGRDEERQRDRLRDAIHRRHIREIREVLEWGCAIERKIPEKEDWPRGLDNLLENRFKPTESKIREVKSCTGLVAGISFLTITVSVGSIPFVGHYSPKLPSGLTFQVLYLNFCLLLLTLVLAGWLISVGLSARLE